MVLEEFDESIDSTYNPSDVHNVVPNFPRVGITCFSKKLIDRYVEIFDAEVISEMYNANGHIPVYKIRYKNHDFALYMSRVGAPTCIGSFEEAIAMGLDRLIMFGTCGVLDKNIDDLAIIIPNKAIRDEGTSYHYEKTSSEISVNPKYKKEFIDILNHHNISYIEGKVWTTDAPFRETREKVKKRKQEGCICVDMECSAMRAVANFRKKDLFHFFYATDNLDTKKWDQRSLSNNDRLEEKEKIIYLALELALEMDKDNE